MATLRFEPIATQVGKHTSPALLFPADVLDAIRQDEIMEEMDPAWTPVVREFMSHYAAVIEIAHLLLGAAPFDRLSRLYEELKEEFTPEAARVNPVYDSHLIQHVLGGLPQGIAGETPFSVLARLASGDEARARLQQLAQSLARSHLDLYRVTRVAEREAEVLPLRGGEPFALHMTGPFLREGDRVLARVVEFGGRRFVADSPYLLEASEQAWLDYFERVAQAGARAESAPAGDAAPRAKPKLTSKQAARRRKEVKAKAARNTPGERVVRHLRYGSSERFWFEYVMDAFAGARRGIMRLAGVPDQPTTLPHHRDYQGPALEALASDENDDLLHDLDDGDLDDGDESDDPQDLDISDDDDDDAPLSPLVRVREMLEVIAERDGVFEHEEEALTEAIVALGATPELHPADEPLLTAYCTLGALSAKGTTALARLRDEATLEEDEREVVARLERGRFAVLRIDRIHVNQGFEAFDLLRQEALRIEEPAATRRMSVGNLWLGWIWAESEGELALEGRVARVPSRLAAQFGEIVAALRGEPSTRLPLVLLARLTALRERSRLS